MEIPIDFRKLVVQLREDGNSFRNIAQIIKKSHSSVQYIINRYNETGSLEDRKRTGRPQKLKSHQKRTILRQVVMEPKTSAPKLAVFIDSIMDQHIYLNILRNNLHASAEKLNIGNSFIFQQDNDPKYTAKKVKEWLLYRVPKQLNTPPQSPGMNPIEHLWDEIGRRLKNYQIRNKDQLKNAILEVWNRIDSAVTTKLAESMGKRMHEVIAAKGGPIDH
ncbi:hypothetical protein QTP88_026414 [Uroleucon formosanum]